MSTARAPGKLIVMGEYGVLAGAPALVMAVDRHCVATLGPSGDSRCHLHIHTAGPIERCFDPGEPSGESLVDCVGRAWPLTVPAPWQGTLDSRALHGASGKLGLGSSAAALTAWAGAWAAYAGREPPSVTDLIRLHRDWQGGAGSGVDVAASRLGGVLGYRLDSAGEPQIVSARLPDGVGFVGVFSGRASSTSALIARFEAWRLRNPEEAAARLDSLRAVAEHGLEAARANAAGEFIAAVASYAEALEELGRAFDAEIVTPAHRAAARLGDRFGVTYKVSGAGGGDVGIGLAADAEALDAFAAALPPSYEVLRLGIDLHGLVTEDSGRE